MGVAVVGASVADWLLLITAVSRRRRRPLCVSMPSILFGSLGCVSVCYFLTCSTMQIPRSNPIQQSPEYFWSDRFQRNSGETPKKSGHFSCPFLDQFRYHSWSADLNSSKTWGMSLFWRFANEWPELQCCIVITFRSNSPDSLRNWRIRPEFRRILQPRTC